MPHQSRDNVDPRERARRYRQFYGGLVFDVLWALGVKETMLSPRFFPLGQDVVLAGHALTVKMHSHAETAQMIRERGPRPWGGGPRQREILAAITPGCVICVDTGPSSLCAHWGELSSHLARTLGAEGLLMAGNVRDTRLITKMADFCVFTLGTTANAKTGWIVEEINVPIYMPGHLRHSVIIEPGDYVFGDTDGVQMIPRDLVDQVMCRCEALLADESEQREAMRKGLSVDDVFRIYGNL